MLECETNAKQRVIFVGTINVQTPILNTSLLYTTALAMLEEGNRGGRPTEENQHLQEAHQPAYVKRLARRCYGPASSGSGGEERDGGTSSGANSERAVASEDHGRGERERDAERKAGGGVACHGDGVAACDVIVSVED